MARAGPAPAIPAPPLQWPLVGRQGELDLFTASLTDPRAHGFVILGPPGVDKTRLADQCLALVSKASSDRIDRMISASSLLNRARWTSGSVVNIGQDGVGRERPPVRSRRPGCRRRWRQRVLHEGDLVRGHAAISLQSRTPRLSNRC